MCLYASGMCLRQRCTSVCVACTRASVQSSSVCSRLGVATCVSLLCMCVCAHVRVCVCVCAHVHAVPCVCAHVHAVPCVCVCVCALMYMQCHVCALMYMQCHVCVCAHMLGTESHTEMHRGCLRLDVVTINICPAGGGGK